MAARIRLSVRGGTEPAAAPAVAATAPTALQVLAAEPLLCCVILTLTLSRCLLSDDYHRDLHRNAVHGRHSEHSPSEDVLTTRVTVGFLHILQ